MTKIYLVLIGDCEGDMVLTPAYSNLESAKNRWQEEKDKLKGYWNKYVNMKDSCLTDIAKEQIVKLGNNKDPFDGFYCLPYNTPFVKKVEVV